MTQSRYHKSGHCCCCCADVWSSIISVQTLRRLVIYYYQCAVSSPIVRETSSLWKTHWSPAQHSCMTSAFDWCQQAFLEHIGIPCGCHLVHLGCPVPHIFTATHCCRVIAAFALCSSLGHFSSPTGVGWGGVVGLDDLKRKCQLVGLVLCHSELFGDKDKETLQRPQHRLALSLCWMTSVPYW